MAPPSGYDGGTSFFEPPYCAGEHFALLAAIAAMVVVVVAAEVIVIPIMTMITVAVEITVVAAEVIAVVIDCAGVIIPRAADPHVAGGGVRPIAGRPDVVRTGAGRNGVVTGCRGGGDGWGYDDGCWEAKRKAEVNSGVGRHGGRGGGADEGGKEDGFGFHICAFQFSFLCTASFVAFFVLRRCAF